MKPDDFEMDAPEPDDLGVEYTTVIPYFGRHITPDDMWVYISETKYKDGTLVFDEEGNLWSLTDWPEGGYVFG